MAIGIDVPLIQRVGGNGKEPHRFRKGEPPPPGAGRKPGTVNAIPRMLMYALAEAIECSGDGEGKRGATGYLVWLSKRHPALFVHLIGRLLPSKVDVKFEDLTPRAMDFPSVEEIRSELESRGLPTGMLYPKLEFEAADTHAPSSGNGDGTIGNCDSDL